MEDKDTTIEIIPSLNIRLPSIVDLLKEGQTAINIPGFLGGQKNSATSHGAARVPLTELAGQVSNKKRWGDAREIDLLLKFGAARIFPWPLM